MSARDQILADALDVAIKSNIKIIRQRRVIAVLIVAIIFLVVGYFI